MVIGAEFARKNHGWIPQLQSEGIGSWNHFMLKLISNLIKLMVKKKKITLH
jgi:hypothetical protein